MITIFPEICSSKYKKRAGKIHSPALYLITNILEFQRGLILYSHFIKRTIYKNERNSKENNSEIRGNLEKAF